MGGGGGGGGGSVCTGGGESGAVMIFNPKKTSILTNLSYQMHNRFTIRTPLELLVRLC